MKKRKPLLSSSMNPIEQDREDRKAYKELKAQGARHATTQSQGNNDCALGLGIGLGLLAHNGSTLGSEYVNISAAIMLIWMGDHSGDPEFYQMAKECVKVALGTEAK